MYVFTPKWLSFRVLLLGGKLCIWEPVGSSIINHIDGSDCSNLVYSMTSTILSIIFCKSGSSKGALEEKYWTNCTDSLFMIMAAIGYVLLCNWSIQTKKQIHGPCMSKKIWVITTATDLHSGTIDQKSTKEPPPSTPVVTKRYPNSAHTAHIRTIGKGPNLIVTLVGEDLQFCNWSQLSHMISP